MDKDLFLVVCAAGLLHEATLAASTLATRGDALPPRAPHKEERTTLDAAKHGSILRLIAAVTQMCRKCVRSTLFSRMACLLSLTFVVRICTIVTCCLPMSLTFRTCGSFYDCHSDTSPDFAAFRAALTGLKLIFRFICCLLRLVHLCVLEGEHGIDLKHLLNSLAHRLRTVIASYSSYGLGDEWNTSPVSLARMSGPTFQHKCPCDPRRIVELSTETLYLQAICDNTMQQIQHAPNYTKTAETDCVMEKG